MSPATFLRFTATDPNGATTTGTVLRGCTATGGTAVMRRTVVNSDLAHVSTLTGPAEAVAAEVVNLTAATADPDADWTEPATGTMDCPHTDSPSEFHHTFVRYAEFDEDMA